MIILGDAGFNYYGGERDQKVKQRMAANLIKNNKKCHDKETGAGS